jgi:hypothetical protein
MRILKRRCTDCKDPLPPGVTGLCDVCLEMAELDGEPVPRDDRQEEPAGGAEVVVDYSRGGDAAPGLRPISGGYRSHPNHDAVTRVRRLAAQNSGDGESDQDTWGAIEDRQADTRTYFPPAPGSPAYDSPFHRGRAARSGPPDYPAAAGELFKPRVAAAGPGRGHMADRWGRPVS